MPEFSLFSWKVGLAAPVGKGPTGNYKDGVQGSMTRCYSKYNSRLVVESLLDEEFLHVWTMRDCGLYGTY